MLLLLMVLRRRCRPQRGAATARAWPGSWRRRLTSILLGLRSEVKCAVAVDDGRGVLQAAASNRHRDVVDRLLAAKAAVDAAAAAADGRTALQAAAENGHLEVVERLLAAKADINAVAAAD